MDSAEALRVLEPWSRGRRPVPVTVGASGAQVWRLDGAGVPSLYAKIAPSGSAVAAELPGEAERAGWLRAQGLPAPEVAECGEVDGGDAGPFARLVAVGLPGRSLAEPWPVPLRPRAVDALADAAAALHALNPSTCPFSRTLDVALVAAADAVRAGLVDQDDLDDERRGRTPDDLLEEALRRRPAAEDLVVAHGDLCLPNVLLDPATLELTGLVDLGRLGVADRHADLALAHRSLASDVNPRFGPPAAERFLRRYASATGVRPRRDLLDYYRLLDEFF